MTPGSVPSGSLAGRRVLVVGAASGIGAAVAERFARDGAAVWAADRNVDGCVRTVEWLATETGRRDHEALGLDVTEEEQWQQAAERLRAAGGLDVFVNAAGVSSGAPVADLPLAEWRRVFAVNVDGAFLGVKTLLPLMRITGGAIVIVTSASGLRAAAGASAYSASKAALSMFVRCVAKECRDAQWPVRINAVAPAGVKSPMWREMPFFAALVEQHGSEDAAYASLSGGMLGQRFAEPSEVAAAVAYLASDEAASITGQAINVDAGFTI